MPVTQRIIYKGMLQIYLMSIKFKTKSKMKVHILIIKKAICGK